MKKNKWLLVLLVIMLVMPTYTVNAKSKKEIHKLKFEDIETLMMERNPTIEINKNTRKNFIDSRDAIRDVEDDKEDLKDAIAEINKAISFFNQAIKNQDTLMKDLVEALPPIDEDYGTDKSEPEGMDDSSDELPGSGNEDDRWNELPEFGYQDPIVYETLIETIGYVQGLYKSNISTLRQNRSTLRGQLDQFDKLPAQEKELDKAILQMEMANEGIIFGAQNIYLGYNSLKRQRDELVQNLELLDDQIDIMTLQQELGMIASLDISGINNQREEMESGIKALETQMDNIKRELNSMLDQDLDTSLKMEDTFIVDGKSLSKIDYKDDLRLAKRNSYSLQLKNYDYRIQNINAEWAEKHGSYKDIRAAARDLENATIEFSQEHKNVELAFHKAYQEVQDKIDALENEEKNLEYEQEKYGILELQHELGMVSEIEFKQGKAEYDSRANKVETAHQNLFQAWLQYEALLRGINFQQ